VNRGGQHYNIHYNTVDNLRRICQHVGHHAALVARGLDVVVVAPLRAASRVARANDLT